MHVERMALVLRQDHDASLATVHEVGKGEVDQAIVATEGHGWLGPIPGQWHQSLALTPGEDH